MMMRNYDKSVETNQNTNQPYIPDHHYMNLITGVSGSGKSNVLLNLVKHQQPDIAKIYLYVKDPLELKYQLLINEREKVEMKELETQKHSLIIDKQLMMFMKIQKNKIQQRTKVLVVFDDVIADIETN